MDSVFSSSFRDDKKDSRKKTLGEIENDIAELEKIRLPQVKARFMESRLHYEQTIRPQLVDLENKRNRMEDALNTIKNDREELRRKLHWISENKDILEEEFGKAVAALRPSVPFHGPKEIVRSATEN